MITYIGDTAPEADPDYLSVIQGIEGCYIDGICHESNKCRAM